MKTMAWFELDIFAKVFGLMEDWKEHYGNEKMTDEEIEEIALILKNKLLEERDKK